MGPETGQSTGIPGPLQSDDQLLHRLTEGLRRLQLVNDGLHVGFVRRVPVQQARPLVRGNPEPALRGDLHDLGVVLPTQVLVRAELVL